MAIKAVRIKNKTIDKPVLQGGMGVGVSMGGLAGAVAACGGLGCISTADAGYLEPDFDNNSFEANLRAIDKEIKKAREISGGRGMIAVNAMVATRQYEAAVKQAVISGADAVISGAGLPLNLPEYVGDADIAIAPIISSKRAGKVVLEYWRKHYNRTADFIVIEGCRAGGHLGFNEESLIKGECETLDEILPQVLELKARYEKLYNVNIPVFVAGGIYTFGDLVHYIDLGASGVQVATRFIATYECDASKAYKDVYINARDEDVRIIHSPVGMPGRALATPLIKQLEEKGHVPVSRCVACISSCKGKKSIYCITDALINAVKGNYDSGLFFCGDNVGRIDKMMHVSQLMDELVGIE